MGSRHGPVLGGIAIGIAIGIPMLVISALITLLLAIGIAIAKMIEEGDFAATWAEARRRGRETIARSLARNERWRQWLIKHHVPPRLAWLLTRSLVH